MSIKISHFNEVRVSDALQQEEALLNESQKSLSLLSHLLFWESATYEVVLGRSNNPKFEIDENLCKKDTIKVHKRISGGGTVLQGPGCLNYSLILPFSINSHLNNISSTNTWIMNQMKIALSSKLSSINILGVTDLCIGDKKFSGNAQRRLKNVLLFHGTILYNFDLKLISKYLKYPPISPDYRHNRPHDTFVTNIPLTKTDIIALISDTWKIITTK